MIFGDADGDAGIKFVTVHSAYPEFLILNLKAYILSNKVFRGFHCFCILCFSLSTFDIQGKVMA